MPHASSPRLLPAALAVLALSLAGCPGTLEDKSRFTAGGSSGGTCADPSTVPQLFKEKCGTSACHGGGGDTPSGGLELVASGLEKRVVSAEPSGSACKGEDTPVADPSDPEGSLLYMKVAQVKTCGSPMPLGGDPLSADEVACIRDWIASLSGGQGTGGEGGSGTGGEGGSVTGGGGG